MGGSRRSLGWLVLKTLVTLGAVGLLATRIQGRGLWSVLSEARLFPLAAAFALYMVFERFCGLVVLAALLLATLASLGGAGLPAGVVASASGVSAVLVAAWWVAPLLVARRFAVAEPALEGLWRNCRLLVPVGVLSLAVHLGQVLSVWLVSRACGLGVPLAYCFVIHPMVAMLAAVPVSLSGLGVREASYVYFLTRLPGISSEAALAFAVLWFAVLLLSSLVGGVVFLLSAPPVGGLAGAARR